MILVDWQLRKWALLGGIEPYVPENINPASIDLSVGTGWIDVQYPHVLHNESIITVHQITLGTLLRNAIVDLLYKIVGDVILPFRRPTAVLLTTLETIKLSRTLAGQIKLKSTPTREGLGHPIADWVDNGFQGQLTLMVTANKTIVLETGRRICQLVLHTTKSPDNPYYVKGHYNQQEGPTPSWRLIDKEK